MVIKQPGTYVAAEGYESLADVLSEAHDQAAYGKGKDRHAQGSPFDDQPMQQLIKLYGPGFALGQAAKKAQESMRLPYERARAELLGAINYIAGAVIALDRDNAPAAKVEEPLQHNGDDSEGDLLFLAPTSPVLKERSCVGCVHVFKGAEEAPCYSCAGFDAWVAS